MAAKPGRISLALKVEKSLVSRLMILKNYFHMELFFPTGHIIMNLKMILDFLFLIQNV